MKSLMVCCSIAWLTGSHAWSFASLGAYNKPSVEKQSQASIAVTPLISQSTLDRRKLFKNVAATASLIALGMPSHNRANAAEESLADAIQAIPFKEFNDAMFSIRLPKSYFAIRRSAKGDLPDSNTGQGRRGATIFTGGDMQKAELIAIERCGCCVL
jgi:hypothetical protein